MRDPEMKCRRTIRKESKTRADSEGIQGLCLDLVLARERWNDELLTENVGCTSYKNEHDDKFPELGVVSRYY